MITATEAFNKLQANQAKLTDLIGQREEIDKQIGELEWAVKLGNDVAFFYDEVPIQQYTRSFYGMEGEANKRSAVVYPNAQEEGKWGVRVATFHSIGDKEEIWLGAGYSSYEQAWILAMEWIAHGKVPPKESCKFW